MRLNWHQLLHLLLHLGNRFSFKSLFKGPTAATYISSGSNLGKTLEQRGAIGDRGLTTIGLSLSMLEMVTDWAHNFLKSLKCSEISNTLVPFAASSEGLVAVTVQERGVGP